MTETPPPGAGGSGSVTGFLGRLHPVTQILVVAAAVHLVATLVGIAFSLANPTMAMHARPLGLRRFGGVPVPDLDRAAAWPEAKLGRQARGEGHLLLAHLGCDRAAGVGDE